MATVLFVCTGNLCRSPSAERLLARRLSEFGPPDVTVESAGTSGTALEVPADLQRGCHRSGWTSRAHVARKMDADTVARADLVIGMERSHVREVVLADPPSFAKSFTLREIVRRGRERGPRRSEQSLADWLTQIGEGRRHVDLMGDSPLDDIPDPMGGRAKDYRVMLMELEMLTRTLHSLVWP